MIYKCFNMEHPTTVISVVWCSHATYESEEPEKVKRLKFHMEKEVKHVNSESAGTSCILLEYQFWSAFLLHRSPHCLPWGWQSVVRKVSLSPCPWLHAPSPAQFRQHYPRHWGLKLPCLFPVLLINNRKANVDSSNHRKDQMFQIIL